MRRMVQNPLSATSSEYAKFYTDNAQWRNILLIWLLTYDALQCKVGIRQTRRNEVGCLLVSGRTPYSNVMSTSFVTFPTSRVTELDISLSCRT